ncbi:hypothetical protein [Chroococcidiopsis cubana]|nr:hypothetical protein [Chroococcidiopsis cubana]
MLKEVKNSAFIFRASKNELETMKLHTKLAGYKNVADLVRAGLLMVEQELKNQGRLP